jgi:hypothetical protein
VPCVYFFAPAAGLGVVGLDGCEDMGREKLIELLLSSFSARFDSLFACRDVEGVLSPARSMLPPRPPRGAGDIMRRGGSTLLARFDAVDIFFGRAGTGGASGAGLTAWSVLLLLPGDGDRKVRSVIDPPLFALCNPPRPNVPRDPLPVLPTDDVLPRLCMRFVWMLPTGSGVVVCERKAAAAAEDDKAE